MSQINTQSSSWDIIWRLAVTGIGQGLFQSPNTRTIMGAAPYNAQGEASGLLATGRVIGQSMSVALTGTIFAALGGTTAGTLLSSQQAYSLALTKISALQQTFVMASTQHCSSVPLSLHLAFSLRWRGATRRQHPGRRGSSLRA